MVIKTIDKITGTIYYKIFDDYNKYLEELKRTLENESLS